MVIQYGNRPEDALIQYNRILNYLSLCIGDEISLVVFVSTSVCYFSSS